MTIPTDDKPDLTVVVATVTAKAGQEQEVKDLLLSILGPTRAEDGCVLYTLQQGQDDPATFVFYENWDSRAALDAHLASPGLQAGLAALGPLVATAPVITPLHRVG